MSRGQATPGSVRESVFVLCLSVAATAGYAVYAGQDTNWDQRNYHLYNVYAWFAGRSFTDVAPAQVQTWLNPLAHLPHYVLIQHLPPVIAGMVMGALAGVNGPLLWVLTRRLQGGDGRWQARACAALVTVMGLTGPLFLSEIGTTFAEYLCSPLVLGALVTLTPTDVTRRPGPRELVVAGFLLGAAVGLKPVNFVYVIGLAVALVVMWSALGLRVRTLVFHAAGVICGVLAMGGYWSAHLWFASGNPIFPFYNAVFRSPLFAPVNFADLRFVPPSVATAAITYPFAWFLGMHPTSELPFRDARFALVAAFLPVACLVTALRRTRGGSDGPNGSTIDGTHRFWLLTIFFVTSYVIWLAKFGIQRYAIPLELLAGVLLLLSLDRMLPSRRELYVVFAVLMVFAVLWSRPSDWGRIPYGSDWVAVTNAPSGPPTLHVMMTGGAPTAYVIPSLSPSDRFIRLTGNMPLEPDTPLGRRAVSILETYAGPIRSLSVGPLTADDRARLAAFGLAPAGELQCEQFQSRLDRFLTCGLTRTTPSVRPGR